jgi:fructose-specific component phosphotransferase system IIB-like protein
MATLSLSIGAATSAQTFSIGFDYSNADARLSIIQASDQPALTNLMGTKVVLSGENPKAENPVSTIG